MSSLASLFNSSASLFTVDIYEKLRPGQSEQHLLMVGRIATAVVVGLGTAVDSGDESDLRRRPVPVPAERAGLSRAADHRGIPARACSGSASTARGAVWALAGGFVLGMFKLTCQAFFGAGKIESPALLAAIGDFNFLYATGILFVISARADDRGLTHQRSRRRRTRSKADLRVDPRAARRGDPRELGYRQQVDGRPDPRAGAGMYLYFSFWLD